MSLPEQEMQNDLQKYLNFLSSRISVFLVEPKYQGNVGAVARALKNSGLTDLVIINGKDADDEAISRSMNGKSILLNARRYNSLEEAVKGYHIIAGTSSTVTTNYKKYRRIPVTPQKFWEGQISGNQKIALVFGREADGLHNTELELCNFFINIPASPEYPVYNLSHAVSIMLYEMVKNVPVEIPDPVDPISPENEDTLVKRLEYLLGKSDYPDYKKKNTVVMIRRIIGRSALSDSEFFKIMGIIRHLLKKIDPWFLDEDEDRE